MAQREVTLAGVGVGGRAGSIQQVGTRTEWLRS